MFSETNISASSQNVKQPSEEQKLIFLGRSCVKYHTGDDCVRGHDEKTGNNLLVCRVHCSKDGCNGGDKPLIPPLYYLVLLICSFDTFMR